MVEPSLLVAVGTMLGVYVLIATERMHRTTATMLGVAVLLLFQFVIGAFAPSVRIWEADPADPTQPAIQLFHSITQWVDLNVVFLLFGMMVIVAVTAKTRIFQWLAFRMYRLARGRPMVLLLLLCTFTAFVSAWIDNVTTMLLVTPVTIEICLVLRVNPLVFLLPEVFASNIGGTATLVGDPPNILVGSQAVVGDQHGLTFIDFIVGLTPAVVAAMIVFLVYVRWRYARDLKGAAAVPAPEAIAQLEKEYQVTSWREVGVALGILGFVVLLFLLHGTLEMEVAVPALLGAGLLLALSGHDVVKILEQVEWPTLVFFMTLFIIVGAVVETGALDYVARAIADVAGGSTVLAIILVLWVSAFLSAVIDNIPFVATMIPVVSALVGTGGAFEGNTGLWWALLFGADLGGNATIVGASANIVTAGMAERAGHPVTFLGFTKHGLPVMLITCTVGTVVLLLQWGGF